MSNESGNNDPGLDRFMARITNGESGITRTPEEQSNHDSFMKQLRDLTASIKDIHGSWHERVRDHLAKRSARERDLFDEVHELISAEPARVAKAEDLRLSGVGPQSLFAAIFAEEIQEVKSYRERGLAAIAKRYDLNTVGVIEEMELWYRDLVRFPFVVALNGDIPAPIDTPSPFEFTGYNK
jgi:hypothetical protein